MRPPEEWCWQRLRRLRWGETVFCPHCQERAGRYHRKGYACHYRCRRCRRMFSDLTGTPFEKTKIPLSAWFVAIDLAQSGAPIPIGRLAQVISVNWRTGRTIKKKLSAFKEDPLIRSIGVDILLWRRTHGRRSDVLGRNGKKKGISDIVTAFPEAGSMTHKRGGSAE